MGIESGSTSTEELIAIVQAMLGTDQFNDVIPTYIELAQDTILDRLYPMHPSKEWSDTYGRYDLKACEVAVYLINKRGVEGETSHEENGTKHSYGSAGVPSEMLAGIVPFAKVVS